MRWRSNWQALALLLLVSCKEKAAPAPTADKPAALSPPSAPVARPPLLDEAKARALLNEWVEVQNQGDFGRYEALYAERFTGIKRAGARTSRFDRPHWLLDRKAMFERPFSVSVSDVSISSTADVAVVEFTQTWTSATFRDTGKKQLVLSGTSPPRIHSEEMKSSLAPGQAAPDALPTFEEFALVRQRPAHGTLLLLREAADENTTTEHPRYISDAVGVRPVATRALAEPLRALVGKTFDLYGSSGLACSGVVQDYLLLIEAEPHFGTMNRWNGVGDNEGQPKVPQAERALDLWDLSQRSGRTLAARLETTSCKEPPRFARAHDRGPARVWQHVPLEEAERAAALAAVHALPLYRSWQAEFERTAAKKVPWESTGSVRGLAFEDGSGQHFVSLALDSAGDGICDGNFAVDLWVLLQRHGGRLTVVSAQPDQHVDGNYPRFLEPIFADLAFDLEGDGKPEFLGGYDFFRATRAGFAVVLNQSPAFFDCPC